jgi:large subunit ribosomal protein L4e
MEIKIKDANNTEKGSVALPVQFDEEIRFDLVKRAVDAYLANNRQKYGAFEEAGKRASAELSRRRHNYRGSYGFGISRVPRKILSRRGTRMYWVGAFAPGTVGGRRAHPPKAEKNWEQKINDKERRKAIRSAISATMNKEVVLEKGHKVPVDYPFVVDDSIESLTKTKELMELLKSLGFGDELKRTSVKKIRAGKGKSRGRKYKKKTGILIVVGNNCPLMKLNNIPGVDVVNVHNLNAYVLAPGKAPGRLTLWTKSAVKKLEEEKLFL